MSTELGLGWWRRLPSLWRSMHNMWSGGGGYTLSGVLCTNCEAEIYG